MFRMCEVHSTIKLVETIGWRVQVWHNARWHDTGDGGNEFGQSAPPIPITFWHQQSCVFVFAFECVRLACECEFFDLLEYAFACIICIQDRYSK